MTTDFYAKEQEYWQNGLLIAGADEAGRGPLAGPVVAAAVVFPQGVIIDGINDSKKLSEKKRDKLYAEITEKAYWSVGIVDVDVIEEINILNAARLAFKKAVEGLPVAPAHLFADYITGLDLSLPHTAIVKGDAQVYSIAAASIVAKVTRDRIIEEYDAVYPEYGFAKHKGYGTKVHREALLQYGPSPIHRLSFLTKILGNHDKK